MDALLADVAWWHANAGGVRAFCIDPIHTAVAAGSRRFDVDLNGRVMRLAQERLGGLGVRVGVENSFGDPGSYQFAEQMQGFRDACGVPGLGLLLDAGHANIHVTRYAADIARHDESAPILATRPALLDAMTRRVPGT